MIEVLQFIFSGFWVWAGCMFAGGAVINGLALCLGRLLRSINVVFRGWPPPHLDADGDWKPKTADDEADTK